MRAVAISFYGHSFSLDYKPPNISPFRLIWVAQRKSEVNGKNCYLKFVCIGKAKVERFQPWLYFLCYTELSTTFTQQFVPWSLTSNCADKK